MTNSCTRVVTAGAICNKNLKERLFLVVLFNRIPGLLALSNCSVCNFHLYYCYARVSISVWNPRNTNIAFIIYYYYYYLLRSTSRPQAPCHNHTLFLLTERRRVGGGADYVTSSGQNHLTFCHSTQYTGICRLDWVSEDLLAIERKALYLRNKKCKREIEAFF